MLDVTKILYMIEYVIHLINMTELLTLIHECLLVDKNTVSGDGRIESSRRCRMTTFGLRG